jgi:hypothetical protein
MDYNTDRKKLVLPEYGRNIHKMVDHICTIEDREERNKAARSIISIMGNLNPHLRDINDFKHKLWDHLALISDFKLDIDYPYEIPEPSHFFEKPKLIPYNDYPIRYKHYGKILELLIKEAIALEAGEKRDALNIMIANHMKRAYLTWNRNVVTDEIIINDLKELSGGEIVLSPDTKLAEFKDINIPTIKRKGKPRKK